MTPYPVKYETLDPAPGLGQMYPGHCPPGPAQPFSYTRSWPEPQSPAYSIPFYSPPLPHFNTAKLVLR